jgi:hypothetical protein
VLFDVRANAGHGNWTKAIQQSRQDERRVQELIRVYERWDDITNHPGFNYELSVRDGLALIAKSAKSGGFGSPQINDASTTSGNSDKSDFGHQNSTVNCDSDADEPENGSATEIPAADRDVGNDVPAELRPILESSDLFETAARKAKTADEAIRAAEESPAYKAVERWELSVKKERELTKTKFSTYARTAARYMTSMSPTKLCPDCKGVEASQDAELCATCGGKGFLIGEDSEANT